MPELKHCPFCGAEAKLTTSKWFAGVSCTHCSCVQQIVTDCSLFRPRELLSYRDRLNLEQAMIAQAIERWNSRSETKGGDELHA